MLQMSWTGNPVTLTNTNHHQAGALESTLPEALSFISLPVVRLPLSLLRQLVMQSGQRGKSQCPKQPGLVELLLVIWFWATYVIFLSLRFLTYKMELILHWQGHSRIEIKWKLI